LRALSRDELERLLAAAKAKRERDWLMILLAFNHGLRASEVVQLTRDNFEDDILDIQRLKGSERTYHPLIDDPNPLFSERQSVVDLCRKSTNGQRLFPITRQRFWQLVKEHGKRAGIPEHKLFPHALKHSLCMEAIESAKLNEVQKYVGHRSLNSTAAYLKISDEKAASGVQSAIRSRSQK
jgi:integrase/recombinase XerD